MFRSVLSQGLKARFKKSVALAGLGAACLLTLAAIGVATPAHAQTSVALPGVTLTSGSAPLPQPLGLVVDGRLSSSGIGQGYNIGGDPTKQEVQTFSDGVFRLGADAKLTGNSNPDCTADCKFTQATAYIVGEQIAGARSVNAGIGTQANPVASVSGTNSTFSGMVEVQWVLPEPMRALPDKK